MTGDNNANGDGTGTYRIGEVSTRLGRLEATVTSLVASVSKIDQAVSALSHRFLEGARTQWPTVLGGLAFGLSILALTVVPIQNTQGELRSDLRALEAQFHRAGADTWARQEALHLSLLDRIAREYDKAEARRREADKGLQDALGRLRDEGRHADKELDDRLQVEMRTLDGATESLVRTVEARLEDAVKQIRGAVEQFDEHQRTVQRELSNHAARIEYLDQRIKQDDVAGALADVLGRPRPNDAPRPP